MVALPSSPVKIENIIDKRVEEKATPRFSNTINPSTIGHPCERFLWYKFRWAYIPESHQGRMLRLFETGQLEEARMIGWLRESGCTVKDRDEKTGEQIRITELDGHLTGYLDGIIEAGLPEAPKARHVLECKTHNLKSFRQLVENGVAVAKPEHAAQMQIYMHVTGIDRALYLAKCKDNDALYSERVKYDVSRAIALLAKGERIKNAEMNAPPRVSDNPDYYLCKVYRCPAYASCHEKNFSLRNCRTCLHVSANNGGQWYCQYHQRELKAEDQKAGCPSHLFLPALVPGEQIDTNEKLETVAYRLSDGTLWVDGGWS